MIASAFVNEGRAVGVIYPDLPPTLSPTILISMVGHDSLGGGQAARQEAYRTIRLRHPQLNLHMLLGGQ